MKRLTGLLNLTQVSSRAKGGFLRGNQAPVCGYACIMHAAKRHASKQGGPVVVMEGLVRTFSKVEVVCLCRHDQSVCL